MRWEAVQDNLSGLIIARAFIKRREEGRVGERVRGGRERERETADFEDEKCGLIARHKVDSKSEKTRIHSFLEPPDEESCQPLTSDLQNCEKANL